MESILQNMNKLFFPIRKNVLTMVDKFQAHLDIFPEIENKEQKIAEYGFLYFNLCLTAQTI